MSFYQVKMIFFILIKIHPFSPFTDLLHSIIVKLLPGDDLLIMSSTWLKRNGMWNNNSSSVFYYPSADCHSLPSNNEAMTVGGVFP